jgi:hypothetical protein
VINASQRGKILGERRRRPLVDMEAFAARAAMVVF